MRTVTVDIINEKALNLLKDLEVLKLIRLRRSDEKPAQSVNWLKYKGAMSKQAIEDIDLQINELRDSWE